LYPPPGNTTTAAPVFFPFGANTVSVGTDTFPNRTSGLPAIFSLVAVDVSPSGPFVVSGPGAPFGHKVSTTCPGPTGHPVDCATDAPQQTAIIKPNRTRRILKILPWLTAIIAAYPTARKAVTRTQHERCTNKDGHCQQLLLCSFVVVPVLFVTIP
jgi:hypothetical protein